MAREPRRRTAPRSGEAWSLACLLLASGLGCAVGAVFPMSPQAPVGLARALAVACAGLGAYVLARGQRLGSRQALGVLLLSILLAGTLVASAATSGGVVLTSSVYVWQAIYAAFFFSRRRARVVLAVEVTSYAGALVLTGLPGMVTAWVVMALSCLAAVEVHARIVERLRRRADTDPLTGLLNRYGLVRAAERELSRANRNGAALAVVVIDLDGFKVVNDTRGHAAGDRLLADVAAAWSAALRPTDVLTRQGGDEFVLLLPGTDDAQASTLLGRLHAATAVAWSSGTATWQPGDDLDRMLARADTLLYEAKALAKLRRGGGPRLTTSSQDPDRATAISGRSIVLP